MLMAEPIPSPSWAETRTTPVPKAVIDYSNSIIIDLNHPITSLSLSYSTTFVTLLGTIHPIPVPYFVEKAGAVYDAKDSLLEFATVTQSPPSLPSTNSKTSTTSIPSSPQIETPSGSACLATLTPSQSSISNSIACSDWKCWTKDQQAGTLIAIILAAFGIIGVTWWGLIHKRRIDTVDNGEDIEGRGRGRSLRAIGSHSNLNFSSPSIRISNSRGSMGEQLSGEAAHAFKGPTRRHSISPNRIPRISTATRPTSSIHDASSKNVGTTSATWIGAASIRAGRSEDDSRVENALPPQRRRTRLASPSKYLPKHPEMEERERKYRIAHLPRNFGDDQRNDKGRGSYGKNGQDRTLGKERRGRERPRSYSPPPRIQPSSKKPNAKRRNSYCESKPDAPSKWLLLLPLAPEAVHPLSEPQGGWKAYLPEHKKHKPRIQKLANDFLEGEHCERSSHNRGQSSGQNDTPQTPRARPPTAQRSSSADMAYSRYRPPHRDRSHGPEKGSMESLSRDADHDNAVRRSHSTRAQEREPHVEDQQGKM